jgi:hypothetical protein
MIRSPYPLLHFLTTRDIMTQTTLFPLKAMGAEGENKKGPTALRRGNPLVICSLSALTRKARL